MFHYLHAPNFYSAVKGSRNEQISLLGVGHKLCHTFYMASELVDELLFIAAPLPGNQVPVLGAGDVGLVIVKEDQVSDKVLLNGELIVLP